MTMEYRPVVLPGQGWMVTFSHQGEEWTEPLIGWATMAHGDRDDIDFTLRPMASDVHGQLAEIGGRHSDFGMLFCVWHPRAEGNSVINCHEAAIEWLRSAEGQR